MREMSVADRATIANMAPEYGATMGFFPVDDVTLEYLRQTGRSDDQVELVERYSKEQGLFRTDEWTGAQLYKIAFHSISAQSNQVWRVRNVHRTESRSAI